MALDNRESMLSIAIRDGVDNTGRIYQEFKRSSHGGREFTINEIGTTLVWGFGIRAIKDLYDKFTHSMGWLKYPHFDVSLLNPQNVQKLTPEVIDAFAHTSQKPHLLKLLKSQQGLVQKAAFARFIISTAVPSAMIGFGLPTLNHILTSHIIEKEAKAAKAFFSNKLHHKSTPTPAPQPVNVAHLHQLQESVVPYVDAMMHGAQASHHATSPQSLKGWGHYPVSSYGSPMPNPTAGHGQPSYEQMGGFPIWLMNGSGAQSHLTPPQGLGHGQPSQQAKPAFGLNAGQLMSNLMSNERLNTLIFVDGMITGGRIIKARNPVERLEWIVRESAIIAFLYFGASWVQDTLQHAFNKMTGSITDMNFGAIRYLDKHFGKNTEQFSQAMGDVYKSLGVKSPEQLGKVSLSSIESRLVNKMRHYVSKHGQYKHNLLFDLAEHIDLVPTLKSAKTNKIIGLDLTRAIRTDHVLDLAKQLGKLDAKLAKQPGLSLQSLLHRGLNGKAMAFMAANIVSFVGISWFAPKVQHYFTYKITGKDYFPGVDPEFDHKMKMA